MKQRKVYPVRIISSACIGRHITSGWRVIEETQQMNNGTYRVWYRGVSDDLREACGYGEVRPSLQEAHP